MSDSTERFYRSSSAAPISGIFTMLTVGTLAGAVLGIVYALVCYYNPFIYFTFFGAIIFGLGVGYAIQYGVRIGKVRSQAVVFGVSALIALISIYFCWAAYLSLAISNEVGGVAVVYDPIAIVNIIQVVAENGAWEIRGATPTGWALYSIWAIEALLIGGALILLGCSFDTPFCESCNRWTKEKDLEAKIPVENAVEFAEAMGEERYSSVLEHRKGEVDPNNCIHLKAHACPTCEDSNFLTATHTVTGTNDKGEEETQTQDLFQHMIVPHEVIHGLSTLPAETPTEAAPAAQPEADALASESESPAKPTGDGSEQNA